MFLPFAAVFTADLATLARSWVLRAWFVLTVLVALVTMLDYGDPSVVDRRAGGTVLAALLHPVDTTSGAANTLRELLKFYVVIWVSFIIVLTGGTICSEMSVVADAILSRGISRWQYFLGKWTSRVTAVLSVYFLVMVPTAIVLGISAGPPKSLDESVAQAAVEEIDSGTAPAKIVLRQSVSLDGTAIALAEVAALLSLVVTCSIAISASFDSTGLSIGVGWVSIYGSGLTLSMLGLTHLSPARLLGAIPDLVRGHFVAAEHCWLLGGLGAATVIVLAASGLVFSRRDV